METRMSISRSPHSDLDTSVLGKSLFGYVQIRKDFQSADYRRMKSAGKVQRFIKNPVHPVSNFEILLVRLDMYVTGPLFHSFGEQHVHQTDHGRFAGRVQQVFRLPEFFQ